MQGSQTAAQKTVVRGKGWEPDAIYDPATGKSAPLDEGLVAPAAIFTNQGVPRSRGKYAQLADGYDVSVGAGEPAATFNSPKRRSESGNAPFPKAKGDPYAGLGGM
jgi:hypothetical protein